MFHQGDLVFRGIPTEAHWSDAGEPRRERLFLVHFATQRMVMGDEAIYVAAHEPEMLLETSWVLDLPCVKEGVEALGVGGLALGSDSSCAGDGSSESAPSRLWAGMR